MEANFIFIRSPQWTSHSGYDRVVQHLGKPLATVGSKRWPRSKLLGQLAKVPAALTGSNWSSFRSLVIEASTIATMARRKNEIWHFLYGEDLLRFSPYLNGWRGHRVIATFHQPVDFLEVNIRRRGYLTRLAAAVVLSRAQKVFFEQLLPEERVFFVPHGVDTEYFQPAPTEARKPPTCIFVGSYERDIDLLHKVIQLVFQQIPETQFHVVTSPRAIHRLEELGTLPNTDLLMRIPDAELLRIYQSADVMIMPLLRCAANNAILEAIACGVPVVATNLGGVPDYLDDSCGVLTSKGKATEMAQAVTQILTDPVKLAHLRKGARNRAEELDFSVVAKQLLQVYQSCI